MKSKQDRNDILKDLIYRLHDCNGCTTMETHDDNVFNIEICFWVDNQKNRTCQFEIMNNEKVKIKYKDEEFVLKVNQLPDQLVIENYDTKNIIKELVETHNKQPDHIFKYKEDDYKTTVTKQLTSIMNEVKKICLSTETKEQYLERIVKETNQVQTSKEAKNETMLITTDLEGKPLSLLKKLKFSGVIKDVRLVDGKLKLELNKNYKGSILFCGDLTSLKGGEDIPHGNEVMLDIFEELLEQIQEHNKNIKNTNDHIQFGVVPGNHEFVSYWDTAEDYACKSGRFSKTKDRNLSYYLTKETRMLAIEEKNRLLQENDFVTTPKQYYNKYLQNKMIKMKMRALQLIAKIQKYHYEHNDEQDLKDDDYGDLEGFGKTKKDIIKGLENEINKYDFNKPKSFEEYKNYLTADNPTQEQMKQFDWNNSKILPRLIVPHPLQNNKICKTRILHHPNFFLTEEQLKNHNMPNDFKAKKLTATKTAIDEEHRFVDNIECFKNNQIPTIFGHQGFIDIIQHKKNNKTLCADDKRYTFIANFDKNKNTMQVRSFDQTKKFEAFEYCNIDLIGSTQECHKPKSNEKKHLEIIKEEEDTQNKNQMKKNSHQKQQKNEKLPVFATKEEFTNYFGNNKQVNTYDKNNIERFVDLDAIKAYLKTKIDTKDCVFRQSTENKRDEIFSHNCGWFKKQLEQLEDEAKKQQTQNILRKVLFIKNNNIYKHVACYVVFYDKARKKQPFVVIPVYEDDYDFALPHLNKLGNDLEKKIRLLKSVDLQKDYVSCGLFAAKAAQYLTTDWYNSVKDKITTIKDYDNDLNCNVVEHYLLPEHLPDKLLSYKQGELYDFLYQEKPEIFKKNLKKGFLEKKVSIARDKNNNQKQKINIVNAKSIHKILKINENKEYLLFLEDYIKNHPEEAQDIRNNKLRQDFHQFLKYKFGDWAFNEKELKDLYETYHNKDSKMYAGIYKKNEKNFEEEQKTTTKKENSKKKSEKENKKTTKNNDKQHKKNETLEEVEKQKNKEADNTMKKLVEEQQKEKEQQNNRKKIKKIKLIDPKENKKDNKIENNEQKFLDLLKKEKLGTEQQNNKKIKLKPIKNKKDKKGNEIENIIKKIKIKPIIQKEDNKENEIEGQENMVKLFEKRKTGKKPQKWKGILPPIQQNNQYNHQSNDEEQEQKWILPQFNNRITINNKPNNYNQPSYDNEDNNIHLRQNIGIRKQQQNNQGNVVKIGPNLQLNSLFKNPQPNKFRPINFNNINKGSSGNTLWHNQDNFFDQDENSTQERHKQLMAMDKLNRIEKKGKKKLDQLDNIQLKWDELSKKFEQKKQRIEHIGGQNEQKILEMNRKLQNTFGMQQQRNNEVLPQIPMNYQLNNQMHNNVNHNNNQQINGRIVPQQQYNNLNYHPNYNQYNNMEMWQHNQNQRYNANNNPYLQNNIIREQQQFNNLRINDNNYRQSHFVNNQYQQNNQFYYQNYNNPMNLNQNMRPLNLPKNFGQYGHGNFG